MSSRPEIDATAASASSGAAHQSGTARPLDLDTIVSLCLMLMVVGCALLDRHAPIRRLLTVDDSWALDLFFKAHQGIWAGKHFAFTYGPLYQWLLGITAWGHGVSLGSFFRFGHLGLFAYSVAVVWASARLLLREEPSWKRALLIVAFSIPWTYFEVREATIVLLFALMLHLFDRVSHPDSRYAWAAALGSAAIAFSFLISGDCGIYGIMALLTVAASYGVCHRRDAAALGKIVGFTALMCAGLACWCVLIGILMGFQFWRDTLAILGMYRWAMASPFKPESFRWALLLVTALCACVFAAVWRWRMHNSRSLAGRPIFLLAAPVFSLLCLQSSLVRSDWYHIYFGWSPALALAAFGLFATNDSRSLLPKIRIAGAFALLVLYLFPNTYFLPQTIASALSPVSGDVTQCPHGTASLDGVCVKNSDYAALHGVADFVDSHSSPDDWIAIFPADNIFGDVARRRVAGGVLQNYVAAGDLLLRRQLDGLERERPALAVYSTDQRSGTVSDIPNLTRSPQVWLYLQSHYSAAAEIQPGLLVLRRDEARRQRWETRYLPLSFDAAPRQDGQREFKIASQVSWPAGADLIRMRLLLRYPPWWNLGKPSSLTVLIGRSDGTVKRVRAIAPPNRENDIWIYPGDDEQLGAYFSADPNSWRAGAEAPVQSISLMVQSMDWFSVQPTGLRIEKVEAVKLGLADQQGQP